jgi:hypothetical protein
MGHPTRKLLARLSGAGLCLMLVAPMAIFDLHGG